jgi:HSP20 family protein
MSNYYDIAATPWRLWDDLLGSFPALDILPGSPRSRWGRYPRVNAWESGTGLVLEAELPGVDPAWIEVSVEGAELTLRGKGTAATDDEPSHDAFERRFELPFSVDPAAVKAVFRQGILTLTLPKAASAQKRAIAIEAS